MSSEDLRKDLERAKDAQRRVEHSITDFDVSDNNMLKTATVNTYLKEIIVLIIVAII